MKRLLFSICFAVALFAASSCVKTPPVTVCSNPLIYADMPDPDVIRVGDDFYMVSTTMYFFPMVPILHSKDLVHWRIVSYVDPDLGDLDCYSLLNGENAYGRGQWATSLRYHNGYYYVLFITNDTRKTYIYRTDDITESGWEQVSVIDAFFHDASLQFEDDGRVFVVYGNTQLRLVELESDLSDVKQGGLDQMIVEFGGMLGAEGSRMVKVGDWYYLLEIDWPMGGIRTQRCWRSREITGPYESRVVCDGTLGGRRDGIAQGTIVDTPDGDWYAIVFQDHGAVGRLVTVQPVNWVDEWPVFGDGTKPLEEVEVKLTSSGDNYVWASDEFDDASLALVWQWNHKPVDGLWSLDQRPGWLRLISGAIATGLSDARNTLTQRTVGPMCESSVKMDISGLNVGDRAGICAFQSNRLSVGAVVAEEGKYLEAILERPGKQDSVVFSTPLGGNDIWLKLGYDFNDDTVGASVSEDGDNWIDAGYRMQMRFTLDYFTGYRTGLYCFSTERTGGFADFDWFHQNFQK